MHEMNRAQDADLQELNTHQALFDQIERQPLTLEQRTASVSGARNTLVLAGAGTGKTSTLAGRSAYLLASGKARAEQILLLAFAREAADEMDSRIASRQAHEGKSVEARTFHALGLSIVQQVEKATIALSGLSDEARLQAFLEKEFLHLMNHSPHYGRLVLSWFDAYAFRPQSRTGLQKEQQDQTAQEPAVFRSYNDEYTRNVNELLFANALAVLGIRYGYRAHYVRDVYIRAYEPYRCCFYLPDYDRYIEIYDVPENQLANYPEVEAYRARIRKIYRANDTVLLEFYAQETRYSDSNPFIGIIQQALALKSAPLLISNKLLRSPSRLSHLLGLLKSALLAARTGEVSLSAMRTMLENKTAYESRYQRLLLDLLMPLATAYEKSIQDSGQLDFAMMIERATRYVREGRYRALWTDILIDEFQDLSAPRYALIKAIRDQNPHTRLFCVGDDWQAIYRFAGSDIGYTSRFESWFGKVKCVSLQRTFRFNNQLSAVASRFVLENASQIRKQLVAHTQQTEPAVTLLHEKNGLHRVLSFLARKSKAQAGVSVLILARFRHLLLPDTTLERWQHDFPELGLRCATVHASKGQEADYVIVLGLNNGEFGFPSGKQTHFLQESLLPEAEGFMQAEERRLFYVALTRARHHVYLLYDPDKPSAFVVELLTNDYAVTVLENKDIPGLPVKRRKAVFNVGLKTAWLALIGFDKRT